MPVLIEDPKVCLESIRQFLKVLLTLTKNVVRNRRSGSKRKGSKKRQDKERHYSKTTIQYPQHSSYLGKLTFTFPYSKFVLQQINTGGSKTKREHEESKDITLFKDRTHSMELRSSQDSYKRKEKKKLRQNTCSSDLLQKYTIKEIDEEFRNPLRKIKTNNYLYPVTNDENDNRKSNSKSSVTRGSKPTDYERKIQTLKNENRKLVYMLESSEKLMQKKLKESKHQTEKIMSIVNKVWKIMQKQVMDPQQRRLYFDKNSPDEIELK